MSRKIFHEPISGHEIGFDLDGVIADTAEAFIRLACHTFNYCSFRLEDITSFQVEECIAMPTEVVERIFYTILEDSLACGLTPMEGAVEVISEMAQRAPVTIITARPLEKPVSDWLDHFFPASTCRAIKLVAMGDHDDKIRYIREHGLRYFVDDRVETCLQIADSGLSPIIYKQPWNQSGHNLPTVDNWQEIRAQLAP
ncbi:MAG: hypothetical protein ABFR63_06200 [Thermodesulfobacteriota bacterium]